MNKSKWYKAGNRRGIDMGRDAFPRTDWKNEKEVNQIAKNILKGYDDGDPSVMDMQPAPLSGEWAGESLVEIFGRQPTDSMMENYEMGFQDGFWKSLLGMCKHELEVK